METINFMVEAGFKLGCLAVGIAVLILLFGSLYKLFTV